MSARLLRADHAARARVANPAGLLRLDRTGLRASCVARCATVVIVVISLASGSRADLGWSSRRTRHRRRRGRVEGSSRPEGIRSRHGRGGARARRRDPRRSRRPNVPSTAAAASGRRSQGNYTCGGRPRGGHVIARTRGTRSSAAADGRGRTTTASADVMRDAATHRKFRDCMWDTEHPGSTSAAAASTRLRAARTRARGAGQSARPPPRAIAWAASRRHSPCGSTLRAERRIAGARRGLRVDSEAIARLAHVGARGGSRFRDETISEDYDVKSAFGQGRGARERLAARG